MPIDSTNYGREIKSLRAEISELRAEVAFMYSAFQDVQEQFGFALTEISNSIKTLNGEIKENLEKNQNSMQDENFQNILGLSKKLDETKKGLTENFNQSLLKLQTEQKNFFLNNFSQLEKISDTQQINFGNHFDAIKNSVAAQQKMFAEIFSQKNSEVIEKISKVGVSVEENQKTLTKNFDGAKNQQKDIYKLLGSLEKLLRLIAANQMLDEVENNLPTKNNSSQKSSQKISSGKKKKIFIFGLYNSFRENLAELLKRVIQNIELTVTTEANKCHDADLIIYPVPSLLYSFEATEFFKLLTMGKKILIVVNQTQNYPTEFKEESRYFRFKSELDKEYHTYPNDWKNVSVAYISLGLAKRAWDSSNFDLFRKSNFIEIENFINEN